MNEVLESFKRFFKNKNTVTVLGVILILILLYVGYSIQIKKHVEPVSVPVATQTIQPRTKITKEMITTIKVPASSLSDNVYRNSGLIIDKYSNVNTVIPAGSMFYKETIIEEKELPDVAFTEVKKGQIPYKFAVDMESTYGNSIFPGNKIDIYMKIGNGTDEKIMIGKLIENIKVLAVKDSSGRPVFENTSETRTPSMLIFGLKEELYLLLRKASYMGALGVELYPVPHGGAAPIKDSTQVSTQQLVDYINAHAEDIPVEEVEESAKTDELAPVFSGSSISFPTNITITYPSGCGKTYTCKYQKNSSKAEEVKNKTSVSVTFASAGNLTATVTESDGTVHTTTSSIPLSSNTNSGDQNPNANTNSAGGVSN